ncbi:MAG TPA: cache domain-containing protein [bacterium]|nr:cache domain-containing protein [bacterium]
MNRSVLRRSLLALAALVLLRSNPVFAEDPTSSYHAHQIVAFVNQAAALLELKGMAAFPEFKVKGGDWWQGDTYIFVFDMTGTVFMHPVRHDLEGANFAYIKDVETKQFVKEGLQIAKTEGSGWIDFLIPRRQLQPPTRRYAYIRTVNVPEGQTLVVGSGFWAE